MAGRRRWLTEHERAEVECLFDEGWSEGEIAGQLGVSLGAVRSCRTPEVSEIPLTRPSSPALCAALVADELRDDERRIDTIIEEELLGAAGKPVSVRGKTGRALSHAWMARRIAREAAEAQMGKPWWELTFEQKVWWVRVAAAFVVAQEVVLASGALADRNSAGGVSDEELVRSG